MNDKGKFYTCQCTSLDHVIYVDTVDTDEVLIGVQLAPLNTVWQRIAAAVRYVINPHGTNAVHAHWSETMLDNRQVEELRDQLTAFLERNELGRMGDEPQFDLLNDLGRPLPSDLFVDFNKYFK
jgi:hypothetical protein